MLVILDLKGMSNARPFAIDFLMRSTGKLWTYQKQVGVVVAVLAIAGVALSGNVTSRVDQSAFYNGTLPDRADRFLTAHFGGSVHSGVGGGRPS